MSDGWIKIHRQIKDWQHYQEPTVLLVWLDLLLSANTKAGWVRGIHLNRGQLVTSVARIMESTGIGSDNTVRDALHKLEASGEIRKERIGTGTKITINHFNRYQSSAITADNTAQPTAQVGAEVTAQPSAQPTADKQEYKEEKEEKNIRRQEDDDNAHAREKSSVVVGLLNFLQSIYGDFNFTPSQVQLIMSKPSDYWEEFKDEMQGSRWLKTKDPALALRLHDKVVAGEYRNYNDKDKSEPAPTLTYNPTPEQKKLDDLLDEWRTLNSTPNDNLKEMQTRHGQLPDTFLRAIGMCQFRGSWHWRA